MPELRLFTIKHSLSYVVVLLMFGLGTWMILATGARTYSNPQTDESASTATSVRVLPGQSPVNSAGGTDREYQGNPLSILLLQLVVVILTARLLGNLFHRFGQPTVLGEIVAGIVLGPSLLGWLSPSTMAFVFPSASMEMLKLLSQLGVVLFMFVVGLELDVQNLRKRAYTAIMVSHASIMVPFFLGAALSLFTYRSLAPATTSFVVFALFIGIAMSITAFPVLARILKDRHMTETDLGSVALTCAAVDDVTAWCILAVVIALAEAASLTAAFLTITLALVFTGVMLLVIRPQLARLFTRRLKAPEKMLESRTLVAGVVAFLLASALFTETIGIHALFGAFLAGVVIPPVAGLRVALKEKIEPLTTNLLLPLFFALTGLRMQISLLNDWTSWAICLLIVAVAITGKLGASMLMARWTGMAWRDSFSLGVLMNTRGLVELIVLNIGYDLGILSGRAFAMLVVMALLTTFMTGPLLSLAKINRNTGS